jgi:uracil-DNA glycosylase
MTPRAADPAVGDIVVRAAACADLGVLADLLRRCVACPELARTRHSVVVGDTPAAARLLVVGEAPGASEDLAGRPFLGRGGRLLDALMAEAGLSRTDTAVLNVLKCRPPANRTPTRAEARRCTGWLDRQVALLDPAVVLTLGSSALSWALGPTATVRAVHGTVNAWRGRVLIASYHPSAALRFGPRGAPRAALEADLRVVAETLACR